MLYFEAGKIINDWVHSHSGGRYSVDVKRSSIDDYIDIIITDYNVGTRVKRTIYYKKYSQDCLEWTLRNMVKELSEKTVEKEQRCLVPSFNNYLVTDNKSDPTISEYIEFVCHGSTHTTYTGRYKKKTVYVVPPIKDVLFNDPATIVFWDDDTKTVVKCQDGDIFDPEKGLVMAIAKKLFGNKGNYNNQLKKWLPKEEE